jgi:hypothetical protein
MFFTIGHLNLGLFDQAILVSSCLIHAETIAMHAVQYTWIKSVSGLAHIVRELKAWTLHKEQSFGFSIIADTICTDITICNKQDILYVCRKVVRMLKISWSLEVASGYYKKVDSFARQQFSWHFRQLCFVFKTAFHATYTVFRYSAIISSLCNIFNLVQVAQSVFEAGLKRFMHEPGYILE